MKEFKKAIAFIALMVLVLEFSNKMDSSDIAPWIVGFCIYPMWALLRSDKE